MHLTVFDVCNFKKKNVHIKMKFAQVCYLKTDDHKLQKCQKDFKIFGKAP